MKVSSNVYSIYFTKKMSALTLTSMNQLADYTDVKQFISFTYLTEAANAAFGNYEATMEFDNNNTLAVTKFAVEKVIVSGINYIYIVDKSLTIDECRYVLAYTKIPEYVRFNIMTIDGVKTLVVYNQYKMNPTA